jgi:hypothetical protein
VLGSALVVGLFASVAACSLFLQEESIPCHSDAECAKYSGSTCDLAAQHCVTGVPADASTSSDVGTDGDGAEPLPEASSDGQAIDSAAEAQADTGADVSPPGVDAGDSGTDSGEAGIVDIDWAAVTSYLDTLYNSTQSLVQRTPASGTYFTSPDNALAQRAFLYLPTPDQAKSSAILTRLQSFKVCGCSDGPGHDATINHQFDPLVKKGATIPYDPAADCQGVPTDTRSPAGTCSSSADAALAPFCPPTGIYHEDRPSKQWATDTCNSPIAGSALPQWNQSGAGAGYADLIALEALSYRNQNLSTDTLWALLSGKWDGVGMNDAATGPDGSYSTYKVALFKIVARALGKPVPDGVDSILIQAQGSNGGIRTNYTAGRAFLDQTGSAETTALTVLAFRMPTSDL